jgi:hypothetical protein
MSLKSYTLPILIFLEIIFVSQLVIGQGVDSVLTESNQEIVSANNDTSSNKNSSGFKNWVEARALRAQAYYFGGKQPYAGRSAFLSAILPGAGQVYNKQSWKLGLVWGGIGLTMYNLDRNLFQYRRFRDAYELSVMGVDHELSFLSQNALKSFRDQFRSNLELNYIALGLVYILNIAEAFISGHLAGFDVSKDLSFYVPPSSPATPLQIGWVYRF